MSLNNEQMLPARVRGMRQMNELLKAEDIILAEIENIIEEMYQKAEGLHEELVNEQWLENRLTMLTQGIAAVKKIKDKLHLQIDLQVEKLSEAEEEAVRSFCDKWLPAHLSYEVFYERVLHANCYYAAIVQDDEIIEIRQVKI